MTFKPKSSEYYLSKCRYYKGEKSCPYEGTDALFWGYEQRWVDWHFEGDISSLKETVEEYKAYGNGSFMKEDGVPIALKAILWNRWAKWVGSPTDKEEWHEFYIHEYLKQ